MLISAKTIITDKIHPTKQSITMFVRDKNIRSTFCHEVHFFCLSFGNHLDTK